MTVIWLMNHLNKKYPKLVKLLLAILTFLFYQKYSNNKSGHAQMYLSCIKFSNCAED